MVTRRKFLHGSAVAIAAAAGCYSRTNDGDGAVAPAVGSGGETLDPITQALFIPQGERVILGDHDGRYDGIRWQNNGILSVSDGETLTLHETINE
jgi:hypothetical protein